MRKIVTNRLGLLMAIFILGICTPGSAQLGVGTLSPVNSAMLEVVSTTKGALLPRMNNVQLNAISSPATGLLAYCTDCSPAGLYHYNGTAWVAMTDLNYQNSNFSTGDDQKVDHFILNGTNLELSLEGDGEANKVVDLGGLQDNLGNHQATQDLNLGTNKLVGNGGSQGITITLDGKVVLANGAGINEFSSDGTLLGNSHSAVPTERAVKTYIDRNSGLIKNGSNQYGDTTNLQSIDGNNLSNVAIGRNALSDLSGGSNHFNVAVGSAAMKEVTNGTANTAIGNGAGLKTTGNSSVFIGFQAGLNDSTGTHRLYIENSSSSTPLIGGDFLSNRVGINRSIDDLSSGATLQVGGDISLQNGTNISSFSTDSTLAGNSDDAVPTVKAVKAYVDNNSNGFLTSETDDQTIDHFQLNGSNLELSLESDAEANKVVDLSGLRDDLGNHQATQDIDLGTNKLVGNGGSQGITIASDGKVSLASGAGINEFSTDGTLAGNSDDAVPTEKAVKAYVDSSGGLIEYDANVHGGNRNLINVAGGIYNTAIGIEALNLTTLGFGNTAVGTFALKDNTTGSWNTALGEGALRGTTSSSYSVALGNRAGLNSDGNYNIFIGHQAGSSKSGDSTLYIDVSSTATPLIGGNFQSRRVGINKQASDLTSGANFQVGGDIALANGVAVNEFSTDGTLAGNSNSAVPTERAVKSYIDGNSGLIRNGNNQYGDTTNLQSINSSNLYNVAIGNNALRDLGSGSNGYNVAIGSAAMREATTGSENTAIGNGAGLKTSGSRSVFIGYHAGFNDNSGTQRLYIESSSSPTPLIGGNFQQDRVGINRSIDSLSSGATLQVGGDISLQNGTNISSFSTDGTLASNSDDVVPTEKAVKTYVDNSGGLIEMARNNARGGSSNLTSLASDGYSNIGLGINALNAVTSGDDNIGIGLQAGQNTTTGGANILIGKSAGRYNTSGNANTFIGNQAGNLNTTGSGNVAIGNVAGISGTTASHNTFIGNAAGRQNKTGGLNVAIGNSALYNDSTGNYNVAIGSNAGHSTDKVGGIYIGGNAGYENNTHGNVVIGHNAGYKSKAAYSVYLGHQAGYHDTISGQHLWIENTQDVNHQPLIGGDFLQNKVGINMHIDSLSKASRASFQVNGDMQFSNGVSVSKFSGDGTLAGNSDDVVPTEKAVKTYVNNYVNDFGGLIRNGSNMSSDTSNLKSINGVNLNNVAIGDKALKDLGSGTNHYNVAIGSAAMRDVTTGTANTAIGNGAGLKTNGNASVFIGYQAGLNDSTGTHRLYIENSSSSTPLIGGSFLNDRVGINRSIDDLSSGATLQVGGNISLQNGVAVNEFSSDTTLGGNTASDNVVPTEKAVKEYIDRKVDGPADNLGNHQATQHIDLGTNKLVGNGGSQGISIAADGKVSLAGGVGINGFSTDSTLAGNSDNVVPTEKAVKGYVQTYVSGFGGLLRNGNNMSGDTSNLKSIGGTNLSNVAIGDKALKDLGSGTNHYNVAIGSAAMRDVTAGTGNIAIGNGAGLQTSGSSSVFIGYQAGLNDNTGTHRLYIESSSSSTPLIGGNFQQDRVGINRSIDSLSSGATLQVGGDISLQNGTSISSFSTDGTLASNSDDVVPTQKAVKAYVDSSGGLIEMARNNARGGSSNLTSLASDGYSNIGLGINALNAVTSGDDNIGIGLQAGQNTTTGGSNILIGKSAGRQNTTGSGNVAIGDEAGLSSTTGNSNTYVGTQAGSLNTTGSGNVAIGNVAGISGTTASHNTFIGNAAGRQNKTGGLNVAIGNSALYNDSTGNYNVAIGSNAGHSTDKVGGIYIGGNAGYENNTHGNVVIGHNAGYKSKAAYSVYLGHQAGYHDTISGQHLWIENTQDVNHQPLIGGDFLQNKVGINMHIDSLSKASRASFQVNGDMQFMNGVNVNEFSADGTLSGDSDDAVPTEKAVKAYVDNNSNGFLTSETDDQTIDQLYFDNTKKELWISLEGDGQPDKGVTLTGLQDDLGNHTATEDIDLNNFKITNGGGVYGLSVGTNGFLKLAYGDFVGAFSSATDLGGNLSSNDNVPTQLAVKTFVENHVSNNSGLLTVNGNNVYGGNGNFESDGDPGQRNIAIGTDAMRGQTDPFFYPSYQVQADDNIAIGSGAGYHLRRDRNVLIGTDAGRSLSISSGNVMLGHSAGSGETGDDKLYISNSGVSNPLIGGDFAADRVGIKRNISDLSSGATFQVGGDISVQNGTNINEFSTDGTLTDNSDDAIPTEKAVRTYVQSYVSGFGGLLRSGSNMSSDTSNLQSINGTNLSNVAIGDKALKDLGSGTNHYNVAIGSAAMRDVTAGTGNTAIGNGAGLQTSGNSSVFIGYQAGLNDNSGSHRLYIESSNSSTPLIGGSFLHDRVGIDTTISSLDATGATLTVGGDIVLKKGAAVNEFSSDVTLSGNSDLAIPTEAAVKAYVDNSGGLIEMDRDNVRGGSSNLASLASDGYSNMGLGKNALTAVTSGDDNVGLGFQAGQKTTSGGANVFIGKSAGRENTTGAYNVLIGNRAGRNNTVGDSNIYIGSSAGFHATGSQELYIDNTDASSPLIGGNFKADKVGINVPVSSIPLGATLQVGGDLSLQNGTSVSEFSPDGAMADNSDEAIPTERAVVTYVGNTMLSKPIRAISSAPIGTPGTIGATDYTVVYTGGAHGFFDLPDLTTMPAGRIFVVKNNSSYVLRVTAPNSQKIDNGVSYMDISSGGAATLQKLSNTEWVVIAN